MSLFGRLSTMGQTSILTLLTAVAFSCITTGVLSLARRNCSDINLTLRGGDYTLSQGLEPGSLLVYSCPDGYYPPVKSRRCLYGRWQPTPSRIEKCKLVRCPDPNAFEQGSVTPYQERYYVGNTTTYECFSDYKLYGSATRVCKNNGKWNGTTPICSRNTDHCPDPGIPAGARRDGHIFNIGDKVTYRCADALILVGSQERTCKESGQWTGTQPECHFRYTYDTPEEVAEAFGSGLQNSLKIAEQNEAQNHQEGKMIRTDKGGTLNIYIAIDVSESIVKEDFEKSIEATKSLIEKISYFEVTPNYDIALFATKPTFIVEIYHAWRGNEQNLAEVIEKLDAFDFEGKDDKDTGTNIGAVLDKFHEHMSLMKTQNSTKFLESQHVIVMFTDGEANMGRDPKFAVKKIKDFVYGDKKEERMEKLDIYMFGVGPEVEKQVLNEYVTENAGQHTFVMKEMTGLHEAFEKMIDESGSTDLCGLHRDYTHKDKDSKREPFKFPWLAEISVTHEDGTFSKCVGSLVSPRFILTAAHCFKFGDTSSRITVTLEDEKSRTQKVKRHIPHPEYNTTRMKTEGIPEFYDYDVALIELKADVKISPKARPICIPCTTQTSGALRISDPNVKCKDHEKLLLNNEYEDAHIMSPAREMKNLKIKLGASRDACIEDAKRAKGVTAKDAKKIVTGNFLCTGGINPVTDDVACKGDSGGALFTEKNRRSVQVGVVSWGVEDICLGRTRVNSKEHTRDFHINLFKVQPFLKQHLGDTTQDYAPLTFID
ncbi:complement factor b, like [Engraulis encrasicolus]|uniref:complement factor b, like n=1 Tax=Engraulis encrasicolus TaxID=184585 RepID=UPI002FD27AA9